MEIKLKAEKVMSYLGLLCLLEALIIGFFIAHSMQIASTVRQQAAMTSHFIHETEELEKQVNLLETQTRKIEREYVMYITGIERDLSPAKVRKSLQKTKKYFGIGGEK